MSDIWKDPNVKAALKGGRSADDIMVMDCPACGEWHYYNQGTHFYCRKKNKLFHVLSEDESPDNHGPCVQASDAVTLADTVTVTTEGYDNYTLPK